MDSVEFIQSMSILSLQPGDKVIIKVKEKLSDQTYSRLRSMIQKSVDATVIVLDSDMDIGVLRNG